MLVNNFETFCHRPQGLTLCQLQLNLKGGEQARTASISIRRRLDREVFVETDLGWRDIWWEVVLDILGSHDLDRDIMDQVNL